MHCIRCQCQPNSLLVNKYFGWTSATRLSNPTQGCQIKQVCVMLKIKILISHISTFLSLLTILTWKQGSIQKFLKQQNILSSEKDVFG